MFLESQKPAQQQQQAAPRAAPVARNARRNRVVAGAQAPVAQAAADPVDSDDETAGTEFDEKMGAKKRAKLEAKAEKKAQREAELKAREEQKKRDGEFIQRLVWNSPLSFDHFQRWPMKNERSSKRKKL